MPAGTASSIVAAAEAAARRGDTAHAGNLLRQAIDADPADAGARTVLGWLLRDTGHPEPAMRVFAEAIRIDPDSQRAHNGLGVALSDLGRREAALPCFERAVALDRRDGFSWHNLGVALLRLHRFAASADCLETALALGYRGAGVHGSYATALFHSGRHRRAIDEFDTAIALAPDYVPFRYMQSECYLALGDYARGWRGFDARRGSVIERLKLDLSGPCWLGDFPVDGKTILVCAEQGMGDSLQFCRYIPLLAERARVILAVPATLARLMSGLAGVTAIVAGDEALPPYDAWTLMMSLPLAFGTTLETIPAPTRYLHADAHQAEAWREALASFPGRKIGLVWAGAPYRGPVGGDHTDERRSITLRDYAPLAAIRGLCLFSLQKGIAAEQAKTPPDGMMLHDWTDDLEDFADTAALVEALDLVISVDTSVVHLAGALGKPVWLLSRYDQCWRWLIGRADSPWYPTLRIFQQQSLGDWASVVADVADALCAGQ